MNDRAISEQWLLHEFLSYYTNKERNGELCFVAAEIKQHFADLLSAQSTIDTDYNRGYIEGYTKAESDIFHSGEWKKVRHGRWLKTGQSFIYPEKFRNYFCSECGFELDKCIKTELPYCPNCGADMQGGENG